MKLNVLLSVLCIGSFTGTRAQNTGTINLPAGAKYSVQNKLTSSSTSEVMGQSMESQTEVTTIYQIQVNERKDSEYRMKNSMTSLKISLTTPMQNVTFDSQNDSDMNGTIGSAVKGYINQPQDVTMDFRGNLVEEPDSVNETDSSAQMDAVLKQLGDPKSQGYGAGMAFLPIPTNAAVGYKWQDSTSLNGVTRVTNYEIKELNDSTATVSVSGTESRDIKMQMQGMDVNTKTTGQFTGEDNVYLATGVIKESNFKEEASGTVSVMGQDIPTKVKVDSSTAVKPL
jgi:Family of unknown function (DUF6263)